MRLLARPCSYGSDSERVDVVETHIARVFLVGEDAYKLRKRVHLRFVDFSTLQARHDAAVREMEINRPHAPGMYLGLVPIMRHEGPATRRPGRGVEWAVHMRRFPQEAVLSHREEQGPLSDELAKSLADMIARYHQDSPIAAACDGARIMASVVEQLSGALAYGHAEVAARLIAAFERAKRCSWARQRRLRAALPRRPASRQHRAHRRRAGPLRCAGVQRGAGDDRMLYDLAFLLMDLDVRGDRQAANTS